MISCESCRELLPEFSLGELEARDHRKVKYHLQNCRKCAIELAEYRRVWNVLPLALDPVDPPATVKVQLMDRVKTAPRVDRSTRRDQRPEPSRRVRVRSDRERRWRRYLVAALVLVGLFTFSKYRENRATDDEVFANNRMIDIRVKTLAQSTGYARQLKDNSGMWNFVYVPLNPGNAYESSDSHADSYAVLNKITGRWHFVANNLDEFGSGNLKLWLEDGNGALLAATNLVIREFGNTKCSMLASGSQSFSRALITLESDSAAKLPSTQVVFEAILLRPIDQPLEIGP